MKYNYIPSKVLLLSHFLYIPYIRPWIESLLGWSHQLDFLGAIVNSAWGYGFFIESFLNSLLWVPSVRGLKVYRAFLSQCSFQQSPNGAAINSERWSRLLGSTYFFGVMTGMQTGNQRGLIWGSEADDGQRNVARLWKQCRVNGVSWIPHSWIMRSWDGGPVACCVWFGASTHYCCTEKESEFYIFSLLTLAVIGKVN